MAVRRVRGDPARKKFPQGPTGPARKKFIPGYMGHTLGRICNEDVRKVSSEEEEDSRRQDLSLNLGSTMKGGSYDFASYAPTRWGMSSSQSALAETIAKKKRTKFTISERPFRVRQSDFIKHGCLRMKN
eukprot:CAMPEP_0118641440 /NCGR_PEP_ID=MMETSP0785-20121206/5284_1 /TAXON_ID=91992 /ORGANISM="Bolidomonas pacifica, Strain CCMP 1866" /LENGTH=128 /DNA_ID=CAMNT_0006532887 /DNA_START=184 /DNA_END=567 /DNA_ORIENTATION=+